MARDWYDQQREGLGKEFVFAIEELFERIQAMPQGYSLGLGEVRRGKVRRFPYMAYFRVMLDRIEVIGVLHGSRDPNVWQNRIR